MGTFPACFKTARITPIYKASIRKYVENYRPIYSLSFLRKVFEKRKHSRLYHFFEKLDFIIRKIMVFLGANLLQMLF